MGTTLLASASVHTTAAACDYLAPRLGPEDDVVALTVVEGTVDERDAGDAANVARTRLPATDVRTRLERGDPAAVILAVASEVDADRVVLGPRRGDPDVAGEAPGSTLRALIGDSDRPLVVVPVGDPD